MRFDHYFARCQHSQYALEVPVVGIGCAIRKDSLPLAREMCSRGGSGGGEACRCLGGSGKGRASSRLGGAVGKSALQGENCKAEQPPWSIPSVRVITRKENPC